MLISTQIDIHRRIALHTFSDQLLELLNSYRILSAKNLAIFHNVDSPTVRPVLRNDTLVRDRNIESHTLMRAEMRGCHEEDNEQEHHINHRCHLHFRLFFFFHRYTHHIPRLI